MAITPIPPVSGAGASALVKTDGPAPAGFADAIKKGLEQVSGLEGNVDAVTQDLATGGPSQIHDLMIATTKAQVGVDMLVQVRNRAVEAYQEVMRLQV